jgi:hypothetical protein
MSKPTLESKIAAALGAADAAAQAAAQAADEARAAALDPATVIDATEVGAAVATATLVRDRLQAALLRLRGKDRERVDAEHVAAWREDYAKVKEKRDAMAERLRERYPVIVEELVALMTNIAGVDKEVTSINARAPSGDFPRLRSVELAARNVDRLERPDVSIPRELRLPNLTRAADGAVHAWPPSQSLVSPEALAAIVPDGFSGDEWRKAVDERDRRVIEDNRRQILEAERRQRELEKQQAV